MKGFDRDFSDRVKNAFGDYNADHLADAGWNAFVQNQKRSRGFLLYLPFWAKAASVAILLSLGGYLTFRVLSPSMHQNIVVETQVREKGKYLPLNNLEEIKPLPAFQTTEPREQAVAAKTPRVNKVFTESNPVSAIVLPDSVQVNETDTLQLAQADKYVQISTALDESENQDQTQIHTSDSVDENEKDVNAVISPEPLVEQLAQAPKAPSTKLAAGLSGMLAAVENLISDAPGVSIGLYAEHKLANNLYIRPGLALAKHNYGLQAFNSVNTDLMYDGLTSASQNEYSSPTVLYNNRLELVAMEIPINFVYKVLDRRNSNIFISAGASSLIYLSQKFTGTNRYSEKIIDFASESSNFVFNTTTTQVSNEFSAFSRADFFGLLNLSAGYTYSFSSTYAMSVEPFVQLPLRRITSNEMRMGFGGVSLKIQIK